MLAKDMNKNGAEGGTETHLNITFSDEDSDNEISNLFKKNTDEQDEQKSEEEKQKLLEKISQMNLLEIIEWNERNAEEKSKELYQNSFSVFSNDKNYYSIHNIDRRLMDYNVLKTISEYVYKPTLKEFEGSPGWIKQFRNLLFVGIPNGVIRIFDIIKNDEQKPIVLK